MWWMGEQLDTKAIGGALYRNAGKPHRHVVEEEGSSTSATSSERDTSNSSDYNSKGEELEGSELPVASSIMKEQNKAPSKRTPTPNVMYPSPPFSNIVFEVHFDVKILKVTTLLKAQYL
jgi:hypothetical protein